MTGQQEKDVTVVATSCNRHDLLARSLESFFDYETEHRIARVIVAEDGDADPTAICNRFGAECLRTGERVGQVRLIDMAYSSVTTPYIFHLEDDYEFYRPGFMQPSRDMLNSNPAILQILLRGWEECQPRFSYVAPDESHGIINTEDPIWHGFSWNPGLRRLAEYKLIGNFARLAPTQKILPMIPAVALPYEAEAGLFYYHHGYYVVILDREGYVRTTGITRHVSHPDDYQSIPDDIPGLAPCPCGSGERFMLCHGKLRFPQR